MADDKPQATTGQWLFRAALVGMVLIAIAAGIGLAHDPPAPPLLSPAKAETGRAEAAAYADRLLAIDSALTKARADFEADVRKGVQTNDAQLMEQALETFQTAAEPALYDEPEIVAPTGCGDELAGDPATLLAKAGAAIHQEGKEADAIANRYEEANETGANEATFLAVVSRAGPMDAARAKALPLIQEAKAALAACR